jgi:hypothetical protein
MPAGRPTDYSPALAAEICEAIASGKKVSEICQSDHMPVTSTVYLWIGKHKEFSDQYAKAQADRSNLMADEILEIADNSGFDAVVVDGKAVVNGEAINRARLRVDTRKWLMSKMQPKKYGDKLETTLQNPDGSPIMFNTLYEAQKPDAGH